MAGDVGISFGGDSAEARRHIERIIRELDKLSRHATVTSAAMSKALGGVSKEFGVMSGATSKNTTELERNRSEVDKNTHAFGRLSRQIIVANQALSLMGKIISVLKFPAMVVAVGYAIQAVNALAAGAVALVGALSSLAGLAGTIPGAIITLGTAALTAKLAFNGLKEALDGNKEAFDKLTPEAQQFVRVLNGIKPVIKDLRQASQQGLFPGLTEGLGAVFNQRNVALLRNNLKLMGQAMGESFAELGRLVGSSGFAKDMDFLLTSAARNFRILGGALVDVVDGFRNIAVVAQPLLNYITSLVARFGEWIRSSTEAGRQSGAMARFFDETKQTLQELGRILGPVGRALVNIFKIAAPFGHQILQLLGGASKQLQDITESTRGQNAIKKYFADAMPPLIEMGRLVRDVVGAFLKIGASPELTNLIKRLRTELLPILVRIMDAAMKGFAPALVDAAIALADLVSVVAGASGPLTGFVKMMGAIFTFGKWVIDNVPMATQALVLLFGAMAVNKIVPITRVIGFMVGEFVALSAAELAAGTSSTVMSRMFAVAMKTMKAALVSTGIGIALLALGLAAEYVITHWEKVGPYFKAVFTILVEYAKVAAFGFLSVWLTAFQGLLKGVAWVAGVFDKVFGTDIKGAVMGAVDAIGWTLDKIRPDLGKIRDAAYDLAHGFDAAGTAAEGFGTKTAAAVAMAQQAAAQGSMMPTIGPGGAVNYGPGVITTVPGSARARAAGVAPVGAITSIGGAHETAGLSGFPALDVMVKEGTPVLAPVAGKIIKISGGPGVRDEKEGIAGYSVYIAGQDGRTYFLTHLGNVSVKPGQVVQKGYVLGVVFAWGGRTHVHVGQHEGAITPSVPDTYSPPAFTGSTPTFDTTAGAAGAASTKPSKEDVKGLEGEITVFQKGVRRVIDPGIEKVLRQNIAKIRKLLSGPVTAAEMTKAKKLFDDVKALYASGLDLNPIVQKLRGIDSHLGRFAGMPKLQAALHEGVKRTRALIKRFRGEGSEGGIQITPEEMKQIENSFAKVGEAVKRGLERAQIRRELGKFKAGMKNVMSDALKSLEPPDATELQGRMRKLFAQAAAAAEDGFTGRSKRLLARAREVRAELVQILADNITAAKQRISSAWSDVMSGALEAFDRQTQKMLESAEKAVAAAFGVVRGQTGASRALAAFREGREQANIAKAQAAANKELADSESDLAKLRSTVGVSAEDIASAEERVLAAKEALYEMGLDAQERALQKEADAQEIAYQEALEAARKQVTEEREILRGKLEERMLMIQRQYEAEEITAEEAQQQILDLLGEYGIETEAAMGATAVFTKALEELGAAISHLAGVLRSVREMATPSTGGDPPRGNAGGPGGPGHGGQSAPAPVVVSPVHTGGGGRLYAAQSGGIVGVGGTTVNRDHVLVAASPGEVILNAAQQQNLLAGMGGSSPVIVQINKPLLLGRSLSVADEIAGAVAPAISRRIGYRY